MQEHELFAHAAPEGEQALKPFFSTVRAAAESRGPGTVPNTRAIRLYFSVPTSDECAVISVMLVRETRNVTTFRRYTNFSVAATDSVPHVHHGVLTAIGGVEYYAAYNETQHREPSLLILNPAAWGCELRTGEGLVTTSRGPTTVTLVAEALPVFHDINRYTGVTGVVALDSVPNGAVIRRLLSRTGPLEIGLINDLA